jgi:hypothetical protein
MDPISAALITALSSGVAGGLAGIGKELVGDAYTALKTALQQKCGQDSDLADAVEKLEKNPDSAGRQGTLQEEVKTAKAADDAELQQLAQALLKALNDTPEGQATMNKYHINAENIGVAGDNAHIEGGIHFGK